MLSSYRSVSSPPRRSCSPSTSAPPIPTPGRIGRPTPPHATSLAGTLVVPDGSDPVREGEVDLARARNAPRTAEPVRFCHWELEAEGPGRPRPLLVCTGQTLTMPLGSMTYLRAAPLSKSW